MGSAITAELSLNTTAFAAAFARVQAVISSAGTRMAALWPIALRGGTAAFAGLAAGAYGVKKAMDLGGELADLSAQTGVAAGKLLVLQQAFSNNGMAAEDVGGAINRLQKAIANGDDAFERFGMNVASLQGKDGAEQLEAVGRAINAISDPAERTAAAMSIFGKSGAKMLTLFADSGALSLAAQEVGTQAELLSRDAALFDDVSDKLGLAGSKVKGFFVGVADKLVPVLAPLLDRFVSLDLAKYGQAIGESVAFVLQALSDGKLQTILFTSAKIAFAEAVNFLVGALAAIGAGLWQVLKESVTNAITLFQIVTTGDFWAGMGRAFLGIAQGFIAYLLEGVAKLLDWLSEVPLIGESIGEGSEEVKGLAQDIRKASEANKQRSANLIEPLVARADAQIRDSLLNIGEAMTQMHEKGLGSIDTSEWRAEMQRTIDSVSANARKASEAAHEAVADKPRTGFFLGDDEVKDKEKLTVAASASRRVGLGGFAFGGMIDPSVKAIEKLHAKADKTNGILEKIAQKPGVPIVATPVFS